MRTLANSPAHQPGELAAALLNPRAVALVGASADASKVTARAQRYLRKHGFRGPILPVNPRHAEVFGEPAFASPAELPEPVDHAFIMVATAAVPDALAASLGSRPPGSWRCGTRSSQWQPPSSRCAY
ncbi:MAG: CoA-binding protein [Proteobacteria bacterium]|nr:CoA-binding protein [Pseudomonadota bacterium]